MLTETSSRQAILDAGQQTIARKGWAAVGLNEILGVAGVPRGSFYYYFESKESFGEVMLREYFRKHLENMDNMFAQQDSSAVDRLMQYWRGWQYTQSLDEGHGRCLVVKLGAEVADLSEPMRLVLKEGTTAIAERVATMIAVGRADGSVAGDSDPATTAKMLYDLWLGASVMAKIHRDLAPLENAVVVTSQILRA